VSLRSKYFLNLALGVIILVSSSVTLVSEPAGAVIQIFTVVFHINTPLSAATYSEPNSSAAPLTAFSAMGFSYPNYIFEGWNTQANGSGTPYADGQSYSFTSDLDLFAQWVQVNHAVTFYENQSPNDGLLAFETGNGPMNFTAISKIGFSNPNHTFVGWNSMRDGSGTSYVDQSPYSFVADLSVYAQWALNSETLSFLPNSGYGTVPSVTGPLGSSVTLPRGTSLSRSDYSFSGWNTMPDGSGTQYKPGSTFTLQASQTLYASWTRNTYVVSFAIPGLKGVVAPISVAAGNPIHLRSSSKLVKPGFVFAGWYTASSGGRLVGKSDAIFRPKSSITLYAHWTGNPIVGLEFSDNGGEGHIKARTTHRGLAVVIPDGSLLHRTGYTFRGWATTPRASVPSVRIGSSFVVTRNRILYALWRHNLPASTPQMLLGSVGIFAPNSSALSLAMRRNIASLASGINVHNRTQVLLYGYATSADSARGSSLLSLRRALAVEKQLKDDLANLNDVGVAIRASGEARLTNSVLASFRNVEVFAN